MQRKSLRTQIDAIYRKYHSPGYLSIDPLVCVRRFKKPHHQEIVGLLAASLSYGKVENIIGAVNAICSVLTDNPPDFISSTSLDDKKRRLKSFYYRFNTGDDIAVLLEVIRSIIDDHGSIQVLFCNGFNENNHDFKLAIHSFVSSIHHYADRIVGCAMPRSFAYLIPSPLSGSACKRLNMYLRWMIRKDDGIDLGVWNSISPKHLMMPVDTHVANIARHFRLTSRKSADWKMVEQITARLREICPEDPIKYDFSLCRFGMTGEAKTVKG